MIASTSVDLQLVHSLRVIQFFQVSAAIVAIYDHITTFDVEVELVWRKKWTIVKVLFLMSRYLGEFVATSTAIVGLLQFAPSSVWNAVGNFARVLSSLSNEFLASTYAAVRHRWYLVQGGGGISVIWSMQGIMQYRISAMFEHSRQIVMFIVTCFICEALAMALFIGLAYRDTNISTEPVPGLYICTPTSTPHSFYLFWVPIICFEGLLFGMALYVGIQWRSHDILRTTVGGNPGIFYVLLRDSILFPFLNLSVYIINLIIWYTLPSYWLEAAEAFAEVAACVVGCRLILNLREAYYLPFGEEVSTRHLVSMFDVEIHSASDREE